jgi:hypothetical protein
MSSGVKRSRTAAALAALTLLAFAVLSSFAAAQAQTTVPCYPPTSSCGTTTSSTIAATTTSVVGGGSTTTTSGGTTSTSRGSGATITFSNDNPGPGGQLEITVGPGVWAPRTTVLVTIRSVERELGTGTSADDGSLRVRVTIPIDMEPGAHTIFLKGTGADGNPLVLSRGITIASTGATGGTQSFTSKGTLGSLARTGALVVVPAAFLGLTFIGVGLFLRRASKRPSAQR